MLTCTDDSAGAHWIQCTAAGTLEPVPRRESLDVLVLCHSGCCKLPRKEATFGNWGSE